MRNKNIRIEFKIKNNLLYRLITRDHDSIRGFCEKYNLCENTIGSYLNLKSYPKYSKGKRKGEWTEAAIKLSKIFKILPEDIFCEEFEFIEKNTISVEGDIEFIDSKYRISMDGEDDNSLLAIDINKILGTIGEREKKVIELRYGLNGNCQTSLDEVGKIFNLSRERIRQIENKAIRKLRHPTRARKLKSYIESTASVDVLK